MARTIIAIVVALAVLGGVITAFIFVSRQDRGEQVTTEQAASEPAETRSAELLGNITQISEAGNTAPVSETTTTLSSWERPPYPEWCIDQLRTNPVAVAGICTPTTYLTAEACASVLFIWIEEAGCFYSPQVLIPVDLTPGDVWWNVRWHQLWFAAQGAEHRNDYYSCQYILNSTLIPHAGPDWNPMNAEVRRTCSYYYEPEAEAPLRSEILSLDYNSEVWWRSRLDWWYACQYPPFRNESSKVADWTTGTCIDWIPVTHRPGTNTTHS